jgi:hypothetical protein
MSCSTCFETRLQACPSSIVLTAGLAASTEYFWCLTSMTHGKIYQRKATTDIDGKLTLDTSTLPDGLLNAHSGFFSLEIRNGADYLEVIDLTFGTETFSCIMIEFVEVEGDAGINNQIYSLQEAEG